MNSGYSGSGVQWQTTIVVTVAVVCGGKSPQWLQWQWCAVVTQRSGTVTPSFAVPFGQTWSFLIRKDHYFGLDNGFMASYACMLLLCRVAVSLAVCGTAAVACAHFGLLHMPRTSPHSPISSFCTCRETRGFSTILLA